MKLRYVGPNGPRDLTVPSTGEVLQVVPNHQYEIPDVDAGHAPDPRVDEVMDAVNASDDHFERLALKDEWNGLDKGSGFLAQVDLWHVVGSKAADTKEKP